MMPKKMLSQQKFEKKIIFDFEMNYLHENQLL